MLNRTDSYRLQTLTELGLVWPGSLAAAVVAGRRGIPPAYLSNLTGDLVRTGVVRSRRGPGGGLTLASPPEEIPLSAVVSAPGSDLPPGDPLERVEEAIAGAVGEVLDRLTIADLIRWERARSPEYSI